MMMMMPQAAARPRRPRPTAWRAGQRRRLPSAAARRRSPARVSCVGEAGEGDAAGAARGPADPAAESPSVLAAKEELTALVAGLDRGFAASGADVARVDAAVLKLQAEAGAFHFSCQRYDVADDSRVVDSSFLTSRWRLIFSSAFSGGSLGGERPGPSIGALPLEVRGIFQTIDYDMKRLDNIVTLALPPPPFPVPESLLSTEAREEIEESAAVTLSLSHSLKILPPAGVSIEFIGTSVKFGGEKLKDRLGLNPEIDIPELTGTLPEAIRPPPSTRSGSFNTVFIDEQLRVTRGDRRELRVYTRDNPLRCAY